MTSINEFSYFQNFHQMLASFSENKGVQAAKKVQTSSQDV